MTTTMSWHQRLNHIMPFGSSTCSKAPKLLPEEPQVIVRGDGCRVWDDQDREFIDFRNSLGPITLGYKFPAVDEAIRKQLDNGIIFGHPHPLECEVAELICAVIPCAEQARFLKTGGEACAAAIKAARCYTGRDHIIHVGYSGWLNALAKAGATLPGRTAVDYPAGVPHTLSDLHHMSPWNDVDALNKWLSEYEGKVAAVIVAASYADMDKGESFYPRLRQLTHKHGIVLIFDEIVTGFRIAIGGVGEYFDVKPDMAVFAKGIANGMPLSVYCGNRELMGAINNALVSTTYGGETLSLAAAKAAITTYREQDVVGHIWKTAEGLWSKFNDMARGHGLPIGLKGFWPCPMFAFEDAEIAEPFFRAAYAHGLSLYNVPYVNFSHKQPDVDEALTRFDAALKELAAS